MLDKKLARSILDINGEVHYQTLMDHIKGVSDFTEEFSSKFFVKNAGKILGMLHDLGKYSDEFQQRIRGSNIKVDHSTAGAVVCCEIANDLIANKKIEYIIYKLFPYAIIGHHSGLLNYGTKLDTEGSIMARLNKKDDGLCDFSDWKMDMDIYDMMDISFDNKYKKFFKDNFSVQMLIRFLFSCLVDGDRLDAQRFSEGSYSVVNDKAAMNLSEMLDVFNNFMDGVRKKGTDNPINLVRSDIFNACVNKSNGKRGFYSLCVPTGGGKTFASLGFALNHAKENGHDRVIYSLPFTSIIEQNARVYADIFGEENVLEHHFNYNFYDILENDRSQLKYKLATENWDMPLIVTTNVQLFQSLYSSSPSVNRKLHNLYNSIIILDEAQAIPNEYIRPCIKALEELVDNYNCTVLFCTATQPKFRENGIISSYDIVEIIDNPSDLFKKLKRVDCDYIGEQSVEQICSKMNSYDQVLTIVNTKKHAKEIFDGLGDNECNFHLSTNMHPNHRKEVIKIIKERLKNNQECRVISTQLIEAGVDIDFPVVFRSISGIDSIVQAAGRCNREGKRSGSMVYVFRPDDQSYLGMGYLKLTSQVGQCVIDEFKDFLSIDAIDKYFKDLFVNTEHRQDKEDILKIIDSYRVQEMNYKFMYISDKFKLIDNDGIQLVILNEESNKLLNRLKYSNGSVKIIFRKLTGFSINVPEYVFRELSLGGHVDEFVDGVFVLKSEYMYHSKLGFDKDRVDDYEYVI